MEVSGDDVAESLFRVNKRRKILRKRQVHGDSDSQEATHQTENEHSVQISDHDGGNSPIPKPRGPPLRKHGITFTSNGTNSKPRAGSTEEESLAVMHPDRERKIAGSDRFVKPTGKVAVVDDKHMTAFIDAKLAEINASKAAAAAAAAAARTEEDEEVKKQSLATNQDTTKDGNMNEVAKQEAPRKQVSYPRMRTQRKVASRDSNDTARDSLVEDIMRESSIGIFDRPTSNDLISKETEKGDNAVDAEEAAAQAFKAQFLIDMEERRRHRAPHPVPFSKIAKATGADRTSHGPKLGGSRQQRERMKAAQAAAAAAQGVGEVKAKRK